MALKSTVAVEAALRGGRTVLKKTFCDAPFKLADISEDKRQKALRLMLRSSSPGVLDEDEYNFHIGLDEGTSVRLETQSYQRIFQMKKGASQGMTISLKQGSSFVYLPHPVVPHKDAIFTARSKIYLADDCSLLWGEVVSCGRKLNDEIFRFTSYHSLTEIFLNGKLSVKENLFIKPGKMNVNGLGQMEGYTHQASLLYLNEKTNVESTINTLVDELEKEEGIAFGVSALPVNGIVVRLLGHKAEGLFGLLQRIAIFIESSNYVSVSKAKAHV